MAGEHPHLVIEVHHPRSHRVPQRLLIATGEIGPTHRPGKQLVPAEKDPLLWNVEHTMTWSVARGLSNLNFESGEIEAVPVSQRLIPLGWGKIPRGQDPKQSSKLRAGIVGEEVVVGMYIGGDTGPTDDIPCATGVIDMAMGDEESQRCDVVGGKKVDHPGTIGWGVDDHPRPPTPGRDHMGIGGSRPQRTRSMEHWVSLGPATDCPPTQWAEGTGEAGRGANGLGGRDQTGRGGAPLVSASGAATPPFEGGENSYSLTSPMRKAA